MTKKIFRSFMVSAAAVLLAAVAIVMTCLYSYFASVQENQLQDQLQLAAAAVETQGRDYLNKLTADRYRLTWIAPDGAVLCDTKRDAESLENHGDRTEVREALLTGPGHSTRYSSTLLEKTSYYARRMPDGTVRWVQGKTASDQWTTGVAHGKYMDLVPVGNLNGSSSTYYTDMYWISTATVRVVYRGCDGADAVGGVSYAYEIGRAHV
mgnify:CR=1 FL=1